MRPNCPVCDTPGRGDWKMDFVVPDGWTLPTTNTVLYCPSCWMIWYDNDKSQVDYDRYYAERYGFDGSLDCAPNRERLDELAYLAMQYADKGALIVDFGGGDGYITRKLNGLGYTRAVTVDVGDELPVGIDFLICAEVLEHIYDVRATVERLCTHMAPDGKMLIELPDARRMVWVAHEAPLIDYQQKHINHFAPELLDRLMADFDYRPQYSIIRHVKGHIAYVYRAVYGRLSNDHYFYSQSAVQTHIRCMADKLAQVGDQPVIVWGCGDIAMHLLAKVRLNVAHYVDIDPAYRGATIGGVPVLDHVEGTYPIVVMAMGQREGILHMIAEKGLANEIIVI